MIWAGARPKIAEAVTPTFASALASAESSTVSTLCRPLSASMFSVPRTASSELARPTLILSSSAPAYTLVVVPAPVPVTLTVSTPAFAYRLVSVVVLAISKASLPLPRRVLSVPTLA